MGGELFVAGWGFVLGGEGFVLFFDLVGVVETGGWGGRGLERRGVVWLRRGGPGAGVGEVR